MRQTLFRVEFRIGIPGVGPFVAAYAFNPKQAMILAQAERIKMGQDYDVEHIWEV